MNISIDENVVNTLKTYEGFHLNMPELLTCMIVRMEENPSILTNKLLRRRVLFQQSEDSTQLLISPKYLKLMEDILLESDKNVPKITELDDLVTKLQELFPKGSKIYLSRNNMQSRISWRGNKVDLTNRIQKFFKIYGNKPFDDVYNCVKKYTELYKYDNTFMKVLPYYIMKDGESQLATDLENMEDDDITTVSSDLNYGDSLL